MPQQTKALSKAEETYTKAIFNLTKEKGYANTMAIATALGVKPPSVTGMLRKLRKRKLINYERYRSITLTANGEALAEMLEHRHETIKQFLKILGVEERIADEDSCEIEHVVHNETMEKLTEFVAFTQGSPKSPRWLEHFKYYGKTGKRRCCKLV